MLTRPCAHTNLFTLRFLSRVSSKFAFATSPCMYGFPMVVASWHTFPCRSHSLFDCRACTNRPSSAPGRIASFTRSSLTPSCTCHCLCLTRGHAALKSQWSMWMAPKHPHATVLLFPLQASCFSLTTICLLHSLSFLCMHVLDSCNTTTHRRGIHASLDQSAGRDSACCRTAAWTHLSTEAASGYRGS